MSKCTPECSEDQEQKQTEKKKETTPKSSKNREHKENEKKAETECCDGEDQKQNKNNVKTDVDLILEEISKRLKRIEQITEKTLRNSARQGKIDTAPVGLRAALKQKMIRGIFGNNLGSAMIRKSEKKRMDRELKLEREEELQHQRDLEGIKQTTKSDTFSKDITSKIDDLMNASQKMSESMSTMNANLVKVSTIVVAIQKRVSPRDVNVGENKKIRYDPLAPAAFQYSEVTASGKSGKIAKSADANRAAFSASRQMAKEAVEDAKKTETDIPDEYSQEKADIAKSEKIDIPTEDINAKRYERIEESLEEIKKNQKEGGFLGGLLKAITGIGAALFATISGSVSRILKLALSIAAKLGIKAASIVAKGAGAVAARAGAAIAARSASKAAEKAATETAEKVGEKAATKTAEKAATVGAAKAASKVPGKWKLFLLFLERKSPALFAKFMARMGAALAGLAIPGPGWIWTVVNLGLNVWTAWEVYQLYQEFSGKGEGTEEKTLVEDDSPTSDPESKEAIEQPSDFNVESETLTKKRDLERQDMAKQRRGEPPVETGVGLNQQSADLRRIREEKVLQPIVIQQPQQVITKQGSESSTPITIRSRNTDPTLATYRASIFDHPVTHPGNFMM